MGSEVALFVPYALARVDERRVAMTIETKWAQWTFFERGAIIGCQIVTGPRRWDARQGIWGWQRDSTIVRRRIEFAFTYVWMEGAWAREMDCGCRRWTWGHWGFITGRHAEHDR